MSATPIFQVRELSRERVNEARRLARPIRLFSRSWAARQARSGAAKTPKASSAS